MILVVIDGLTPSMFEAAATPTLRLLGEHGEYRARRVDVPVADPGLPGLDRDGRSRPGARDSASRVVEPRTRTGWSSTARRSARFARPDWRAGLKDTIIDLSARHLGTNARTIFETLEGDGLTTAAVNITCYRGGTKHIATIPGVPAVYGPKHFFFYSLYESDRTGAPLAVRSRALGSIDAYAAAVGRWLVTRDAFDLLVFYLPDYDYASHAGGPDTAHEALARSDSAIAALMAAAGGPDEFLERYALVVCSDHGQSKVEQTAALDAGGDLVTASNRAAMVYTANPRAVAERLDAEPSAGIVLFLEDGRGRRAPRRRRGPRLARRGARRPGARGGRAAQPELGRGARLGRPRLGVRRPRRRQPSRRRQPRLARGRRLRGADALGRPRPAARVDHHDQGADHRPLRVDDAVP